MYYIWDKKQTYTLNGSFGSDVNVILNVTLADEAADSPELVIQNKKNEWKIIKYRSLVFFGKSYE